MERRTFLKTVAAGIGASMIGTHADAQDASRQASGKRVIVAGAGISGLCCAYELMQRGIDVTVLEASGRYGGHVFTGHDGLSDGLWADYGADHLTKPGYEQFFRYVEAFGLEAVPYPNAEGSPLPANNGQLTQIGGKFYTDAQLADPVTLKAFGFNEREIAFLSQHPWYELPALYLTELIARFHDPSQPFGNGCDDLDAIDLDTLYARQGASQRARDYLGGQHVNALYGLWRFAVMKDRGIPLSEGETFHLKGGNEEMPKAFAARLGARVKLDHPITDGVDAPRRHRCARVEVLKHH
ncbi:flavin monoamine oxidase family protein [Hephaestia mangrovi]|uniref:flavin monoamine oxidase family protein n=1 Tax=Hephaestia mangrovi TaxID=2873268 RepID=UPI001CA6D6C2|nr:FAD-dependent oxidoreductase [Hephaestia mangrovi]MBY8827958.1 FAD-dependent oxidoreductase [Hephaestia mangrovi]